jgi:GTPase involved in cell partitioning and DNA repair
MGDGLRDVDVGGLRRRAEADGGQGEDVVIDVPAGTVLDLRRAYP